MIGALLCAGLLLGGPANADAYTVSNLVGSNVTGAYDTSSKVVTLNSSEGTLDASAFSSSMLLEDIGDLIAVQMDAASQTMYLPADSDSIFMDATNLKTVDTTGWDTSNVTRVCNMFWECNSLTSIDMSGFDLSKVTDASDMLYGCDALEVIQTPKKSAQVAIELPYLYASSNGTVYHSIPANLNKSVTLTKAALTNATISLQKSSYAYTGKEIKPDVTIKVGGYTLKQGTDYVLSYVDNIKVGTASVRISCIGDFSGMATKTFAITKAANPMKVHKKTITVKASKLKKKAVKKKALTVSKAAGTVTFQMKSGNAKIKVSKKNGKITLKKNLKKGTYKVKVVVKAVGNDCYKAKKVVKTVKVKVK
ncbi:BspA family leucine-rich repeat surface protein [Eubacterium oxidoreducens]|nr:BspA family leucine-rich repeat surface protein [Eubacterium oxidoreducens]